MQRTATPAILLLSILAAVVVLAKPVYALTCPAGWRAPTQNEINAGLPADKCLPPTDTSGKALNADESGPAKEYLKSIFSSGGKCSNLTEEKDKIGALNPTFAVCAATFLKAVRIQDPSIRITSAYRTTEHQTCLCGRGSQGCAAGGNSNHQLGIALDLVARNYDWLHAQIRKFNGLRHLTIANDPYHMEAVKSGPCLDPNYKPSTFTADPYSGATPTSALTNQIRQAFGLQPQQQQVIPQQTTQNQQTVFSSPPTLSTMATSTTLPTSTINTLTGTTTNPSLDRLIENLAGATSTKTATTVVVSTLSTSSIDALRAKAGGIAPPVTNSSAPIYYYPNAPQTGIQQTFVQNTTPSPEVQANLTTTTTLGSVLNAARAVLQQMLTILQPMRGQILPQNQMVD